MIPDAATVATRSDAAQFGCVTAAWQAHHAELQAYLAHRLSDADGAADLLHDVFVKAMRQGQGFCALDNPRAWLFRVARNALVDRVRAAHPTVRLPDNLDELQAPEPQALPSIDALADCLSRCLGELSPQDAAILRACDIEGKTLRDFALVQRLSLPATESRLLRARQRVRERLTTACQVRFDGDGRVAGHVPRFDGG